MNEKESVANLISKLPEFEKELLSMRFGLNDRHFTVEECALHFNKTIASILYIETKALRRLRNPKRSMRLKEYLDIDYMDNPWIGIEKVNNEYVANCDIEKINTLRKKIKNDSKQLILSIVPQPYVGNPHTSIIYFLLANPSPLGTEINYPEELLIKNLSHRIERYPFFLINPKYKENDAYVWWFSKLQHLIKGTSIKAVSQYFFAIDFMAYFSEKYPYLNDTFNLPSQEYSCSLIKKAIKENKVIIIARFLQEWYKKVPELKAYDKTIELINPRNVIISNENIKIKKNGYTLDTLLKLIKNMPGVNF